MATYSIRPERKTLHGRFSRDLPPVLTVESGDTVRFETLDAGWNVEPWRSTIASERPRKFEPRDPELDDGHALCGPVAIRGAEPGMLLAVHINEIRPGKWGYTWAGGWPSKVNDRLGVSTQAHERILLWDLDADSMTGHQRELGFKVRLRPFMGVMGMPPAEPGWHGTPAPRRTGGNLDCKELVAGGTLYLPIEVHGGLFSTGDGHAAQGDGEVCSTAIECPMEVVDLTFELLDGPAPAWPRARTPGGLVALGCHEDLHEAAMLALENMLDWMCARHAIHRDEALALASVTVDLHVTQLVNGGVVGAHAILPYGALEKEPAVALV